MIKVLFFARLSEQLGTRELLVDVDKAVDTQQLFEYLLGYQTGWDDILKSQTLLTAVNQNMTKHTAALKDGDEVAFFPPVTGG